MPGGAGGMSAGIEAAKPSTGRSEVPRPSRVTVRGLARVAPHAVRDVSYLLLVAAALVWAYLRIRWAFIHDVFAFDFQGTIWEPAAAILAGRSPYPDPVLSQIEIGNPALYPPLLMVLTAPLTLLPWSLGFVAWMALLYGALAMTLYTLDVRDARCYALAFISGPALSGLLWGNATLLLVPLVALAWRWRDRPFHSGTMVGLAIASKLFLWPLFFWLLGTRRYRAFLASAVVACAGVFVPWAVIGFDGLTAYPDLLRVAERFFAVHSYSMATVGRALGVDVEFASRGTIVLGLAVAAIAYAAGRRSLDSTSISLAVLAAILGSPILWEYYYTLLLVPIAIARPRFSALWLALPLFFFTNRLPRTLLNADELEVGGSACCIPDGVPAPSWIFNHSPPVLWPALGHALLATAIVAFIWLINWPRDAAPTAGLRAN